MKNKELNFLSYILTFIGGVGIVCELTFLLYLIDNDFWVSSIFSLIVGIIGLIITIDWVKEDG